MSGGNIRDLWYDWLGLNTFLFKEINQLSDIPVYKQVMMFFTIFGDKTFVPYFLTVIIGYAIISSIAHHGAGKHRLLSWFNLIIVMVGGLAIDHIVGDYMKSHFAFVRPYAGLPMGQVIQLEFKTPEAAYQSFPSGHAMIITAIIAGLWPIMNEGFRWAGIAMVFAVCWSRIALGVHYPMDVLSGMFISLFGVILLRGLLFKTYAILNGILQLLGSARGR